MYTKYFITRIILLMLAAAAASMVLWAFTEKYFAICIAATGRSGISLDLVEELCVARFKEELCVARFKSLMKKFFRGW